jgi:hypothetical protein
LTTATKTCTKPIVFLFWVFWAYIRTTTQKRHMHTYERDIDIHVKQNFKSSH